MVTHPTPVSALTGFWACRGEEGDLEELPPSMSLWRRAPQPLLPFPRAAGSLWARSMGTQGRSPGRHRGDTAPHGAVPDRRFMVEPGSGDGEGVGLVALETKILTG